MISLELSGLSGSPSFSSHEISRYCNRGVSGFSFHFRNIDSAAISSIIMVLLRSVSLRSSDKTDGFVKDLAVNSHLIVQMDIEK